MMEVEAANMALIEEFMRDKMRPRDIDALEAQPQQPQEQVQAPQEIA